MSHVRTPPAVALVLAVAHPLPDAGAIEPVVWAHTVDGFYRLDLRDKVVRYVKSIAACGNVTDIAVARDGQVFATGAKLWSFDAKGACTVVGASSGFPADQPFGLTFVPKGTLDATDDALVTYTGSHYVRVNKVTGTGEIVTNSALGTYAISGDLVAVEGGKMYVVVTGNGCGDCIVEADPKTGALVKKVGDAPAGKTYGIGFWAGKLYTFAGNFKVHEVSILSDGTLGAATELTVMGAVGGTSWYGAGTSLRAPLK